MNKTTALCFSILTLFQSAIAQVQGFIWITNTSGYLTITGYNGSGGAVTIPTNINGLIVNIGTNAFEYNTNLTEVTVPNSVSNIGDSAFSFCDSLTNLLIGEGVASMPDYMCVGCVNLLGVTMPSDVTNLGVLAFGFCSSLRGVVIPDNVQSIGDMAFENCGLTEVTIQKGVSYLGTSTFAGCRDLTNFFLSNNFIGDAMFWQCLGLTNLVVPDCVTNIGDEAFFQCSNLLSVMIPSNVAMIGDSAFMQCVKLTNAAISNGVTVIGDGAFDGCTSLSNLTIPASITNIGSDAFENSGLTNVLILGDAVIGEYAFSEVPLINLAIAGGAIGEYSFFLCTNLTTVALGNGVTDIGDVAFNGDPISSISIPGTVTNIGGNSFGGCRLTNLIIGDGVKVINDYAFLGNLFSSLYIPPSVTSIGDQAFDGCNNLTNVIIGPGVTNMVTGAFFECANLTNVLFLGNSPAVIGIQDGPVFNYSPNVTVYYLPGTTGWSNTYGAAGGYAGAPTALWNPVIEAEAGDGSFGVNNGQFGFEIKGTPGIPIVVEACTNLANPVWTPVQAMTVTNGLVYFSDPDWSNYPTRYYGIGFP